MPAKTNNANHSSKDAGIELGAWILSTVFFGCTIWMAVNVLQHLSFFYPAFFH